MITAIKLVTSTSSSKVKLKSSKSSRRIQIISMITDCIPCWPSTYFVHFVVFVLTLQGVRGHSGSNRGLGDPRSSSELSTSSFMKRGLQKNTVGNVLNQSGVRVSCSCTQRSYTVSMKGVSTGLQALTAGLVRGSVSSLCPSHCVPLNLGYTAIQERSSQQRLSATSESRVG